MALELIESPAAQLASAWEHSPVPPAVAIAGFHSVTLTLEQALGTTHILTTQLGFTEQEGETSDSRRRFTSTGDIGAIIDIVTSPDAPRATTGAGGVHHVAFRAADDEAQVRFQDAIQELGLNVSPVLDRSYFHSIYFREPGGVLFEIATDNPGFTADEPLESLGTVLKLPAWMESQRASIETRVSPLTLPTLP